eukprot:692368-Prymnesium_polylepis.1
MAVVRGECWMCCLRQRGRLTVKREVGEVPKAALDVERALAHPDRSAAITAVDNHQGRLKRPGEARVQVGSDDVGHPNLSRLAIGQSSRTE